MEFKKTYEIVVGEIVACNLQAKGILSKTWNFIRALHDGCLMSVWVKYLCFPPKYPLQKSLRQGCHNPQSMISFYIFINDVLPNYMVNEFVRKPGVEEWMSVDDMV